MPILIFFYRQRLPIITMCSAALERKVLRRIILHCFSSDGDIWVRPFKCCSSESLTTCGRCRNCTFQSLISLSGNVTSFSVASLKIFKSISWTAFSFEYTETTLPHSRRTASCAGVLEFHRYWNLPHCGDQHTCSCCWHS